MLQSQSKSSYLNSLFIRIYNWLVTTLEGAQIKGNISVLDGIRAIACLSVVMYHINLITTQDIILWKAKTTPSFLAALAFSGDTGVTLFFVLSGFLLFLPYAKALLLDGGKWPSIWQFYTRRVFRILPVYYLSLFLMIVILHRQYLRPDHLRQVLIFMAMFMDSFSSTYKQINGPFWTLAVEWQFYLLLPWMALAISWVVRWASEKNRFFVLTGCLFLLATWGISTRFLGTYLTDHPQASFILPRSIMNYILPFIYGPPISGLHGKFLEDFAVGMFAGSLYVLVSSLPEEHTLRSFLKKVSPWLFIAGLLLFSAMAVWKFNVTHRHTWRLLDPLTGTYNVIGEFGFALSYGLAAIAIVFGYEMLRRPFEWRPLRWIGLLSYSVYMWHLILLEHLTTSVVVYLSGMHHLVMYSIYWIGLLLIVFPLAFLFFIVIEKPGMLLGRNIRLGRT